MFAGREPKLVVDWKGMQQNYRRARTSDVVEDFGAIAGDPLHLEIIGKMRRAQKLWSDAVLRVRHLLPRGHVRS